VGQFFSHEWGVAKNQKMGLSYYQVAGRGYIRRSISDATLIDLFLFYFMYWIMDLKFYAPFLGL